MNLWGRVIHEKLILAQLPRIFCSLYGTNTWLFCILNQFHPFKTPKLDSFCYCSFLVTYVYEMFRSELLYRRKV
jgi:hypothetical protein